MTTNVWCPTEAVIRSATTQKRVTSADVVPDFHWPRTERNVSVPNSTVKFLAINTTVKVCTHGTSMTMISSTFLTQRLVINIIAIEWFWTHSHPSGRTLISDWSWLICKQCYNGCLWEFFLLKFSQNFLSKAWIKGMLWKTIIIKLFMDQSEVSTLPVGWFSASKWWQHWLLCPGSKKCCRCRNRWRPVWLDVYCKDASLLTEE